MNLYKLMPISPDFLFVKMKKNLFYYNTKESGRTTYAFLHSLNKVDSWLNTQYLLEMTH